MSTIPSIKLSLQEELHNFSLSHILFYTTLLLILFSSIILFSIVLISILIYSVVLCSVACPSVGLYSFRLCSIVFYSLVTIFHYHAFFMNNKSLDKKASR